MADEDTELTTLGAIVALLLNAKLSDPQRRRIIQYATARCLTPEPRAETNQASAYLQQFGSQYKGLG